MLPCTVGYDASAVPSSQKRESLEKFQFQEGKEEVKEKD